MPTYAYACSACGHQFDIYQAFTDHPLTVCPECGGALRKQFGNVGVVFKGSGFYRNDARGKQPTAAGASASSGTSDSSGASGGASAGSGGGSGTSGGSGGGSGTTTASSSGGSSGSSGTRGSSGSAGASGSSTS